MVRYILLKMPLQTNGTYADEIKQILMGYMIIRSKFRE